MHGPGNRFAFLTLSLCSTAFKNAIRQNEEDMCVLRLEPGLYFILLTNVRFFSPLDTGKVVSLHPTPLSVAYTCSNTQPCLSTGRKE